MRTGATMLAALALLSLNACGGQNPSADPDHESLSFTLATEPSAASLDTMGSDVVSVGTCLTGETLGDDQQSLTAAVREFGVKAYESMSDDPRWDAVIDCDKPHGLEVYGLVQLPGALEEKIFAYDNLLVSGSSLSARIMHNVTHQCTEKLAPVAAVMAASDLAVDVSPLVADDDVATVSWNPLSPSAWEAGNRSFACLFKQGSPGTASWSDVVTANFPLEDRLCIGTTTYVPCDEPHQAERIATLIVNRAVERGQLRGHQALDPAGNLNLRRTQWRALDEVCKSYLDAVSGNPPDGLTGVADTYPELYPDELGDYVIYCLAQSPFNARPIDRVSSKGSVYDD